MQEILRLFSGNIKNPPSPLTSVLTLSQTWSQWGVPEACSSPGTPSPSTNMSYLHCKASPEFLNLTRQTPYNLERSLHISSFGHCTKKSPGSSPGLLDPAGKTPLCTWQLHWQPEILREGSGDWPAAQKVWPIFFCADWEPRGETPSCEVSQDHGGGVRNKRALLWKTSSSGSKFNAFIYTMQANDIGMWKLIVPGSSTY